MLHQQKLGNDVYMVETVEELRELIALFKSLDPKTPVSIDTETSGLNFLKDRIAGPCIGYKDKLNYKGYYIPIRHTYHPNNLPIELVMKFINFLIHKFAVFYFNRGYDYFMLELDGIVFDKSIKSHDVQIMAWEATNEGYPSLKEYYKRFCNKTLPTFVQTVSKTLSDDDLEDKYNFMLTDPTVIYPYAAYDPIATLELGETLMRKFPQIKRIYPLDNKVAELVRQGSKLHLAVDYDEVARYKELAELRLRNIRQEIFHITGYQFNLDSTREKGEALSRFVTLTVKTGKGQFSVKNEVLKDIDHPLAKLMIEYAEVRKFLSSYIDTLAATKGKSTRINVNTVAAPTARFATGGAANNPYFANFNIQAVPKDTEVLYVHPDDKLGLILTTEPEGALGTCETKSGFRRCFSAPEGCVFISCDFSQEELRLVTNMAHEKVWGDAFNAGDDIHMNTAKLAFGLETKEARGHAKSISFGLLYGMSTFSLAKRLGVSVQKAEEIVAKYFGALTSLKKWIVNQKQEARKRMMVYTYFGRPRDLSPYYNTSDPKKIAFGDRSAVNGPIQASGADVLRKKICEIDKYMDEHPEFKQNVTMAFSVYDEINFYVKAEYAEQACKIIPQLMYEMHDNWICPLIVELGVGTSWGSLIDNPIYKNGKIIDSPNIKWYENCKPVDA